MAITGKRNSSAESLAVISNVLLGAFVILSLYFARDLLVPLALSALLTFMLAPVVTRLQRWLGRVGAVLLVVAMMFALTGGLGWVLSRQAIDLANELPGYKDNIQVKLRAIQVPSHGPFSRLSNTLEELKRDLPGSTMADASPVAGDIADEGTQVTRVEVVNVTYGISVAVGLYFIGVPNAVLWGALATVLRFIPYIGPWIAAAFPILPSLASSPGWMAPLLTIGLFVVLELISNNVMEPWLYGASTGVTPFALIVAAFVWTWLWGPVGLVLATPLTVCLVVMGRHIPKLAFLSIVLSDEDALTPSEDCYQRLLRVG
jgi:predicted PurR-regulated permease PerM